MATAPGLGDIQVEELYDADSLDGFRQFWSHHDAMFDRDPWSELWASYSPERSFFAQPTPNARAHYERWKASRDTNDLWSVFCDFWGFGEGQWDTNRSYNGLVAQCHEKQQWVDQDKIPSFRVFLKKRLYFDWVDEKNWISDLRGFADFWERHEPEKKFSTIKIAHRVPIVPCCVPIGQMQSIYAWYHPSVYLRSLPEIPVIVLARSMGVSVGVATCGLLAPTKGEVILYVPSEDKQRIIQEVVQHLLQYHGPLHIAVVTEDPWSQDLNESIVASQRLLVDDDSFRPMFQSTSAPPVGNCLRQFFGAPPDKPLFHVTAEPAFVRFHDEPRPICKQRRQSKWARDALVGKWPHWLGEVPLRDKIFAKDFEFKDEDFMPKRKNKNKQPMLNQHNKHRNNMVKGSSRKR